jgi:EAL domain-containing protein (putative c-di-GMP-specific phosphodiesterase class I)
VIGYEALMRGPRGTPYESPPLAFAMAATLDLLEQLDCRCIELASTVACDGLLFLNAHPRTIMCSDVFWATVGAFARETRYVVFEVQRPRLDFRDTGRQLARRASGFRPPGCFA